MLQKILIFNQIEYPTWLF